MDNFWPYQHSCYLVSSGYKRPLKRFVIPADS